MRQHHVSLTLASKGVNQVLAYESQETERGLESDSVYSPQGDRQVMQQQHGTLRLLSYYQPPPHIANAPCHRSIRVSIPINDLLIWLMIFCFNSCHSIFS